MRQPLSFVGHDSKNAMSTPFIHPVRVYWEDTDAGGVVYHANYVAFLERARSEWMRSLGFGQQSLRDELGVLFVVRDMRVDFRWPARLDDALEVSVAVKTLKHASLILAQEVRCQQRLLLDADVRIAALSAATFRPCAIPDDLAERIHTLESRAEK